MKKIILIAVAMLAGCAQEPTEDANAIEQMVFDAWMLEQVNGGVDGSVAVKQPNGMYVEFISDGDQNIPAAADDVVWLRLDYTSTDLDGNVFQTRSEQMALQLGTFTPHTFYAPEMVEYDPSYNLGMISGRFYALGNDLVKVNGSTIKMAKGTRVKLYIPAHLSYAGNGFSNDKGFGGQRALEAGQSIIEELEVVDVVESPGVEEETVVKEFARDVWGLDVEEPTVDTITEHFYVDTVGFAPEAELLAQFPAVAFDPEQTLTKDSEVDIWFVGRFLPTAEYPDGFVFDSNIKSVYDEFYRRNLAYRPIERDDYDAMNYKPARDKSSYLEAFYDAIPRLRRGQWSRVVFVSDYGYGASGSSNGSTVIPPYSPLIFEIYIEVEE